MGQLACFLFIALFLEGPVVSGFSVKTEVPIDCPDLSFVPEMERTAELDVATKPRPWASGEKTRFSPDVNGALAEWKKQVPEIKKQLTPERVRALSRWAKPQMEQYKAVPGLDKINLVPVGTDPKQETLILEGTIDTLPTHHPLVTRWLKVYVLFNQRSKLVTKIIFTIRGQRLE